MDLQLLKKNSSDYITVSHNNLLEDTQKLLMKKSRNDLSKSLIVNFKNDVGYDAGGLLWEFFFLNSEGIFEDHKHLFQAVGPDNSYIHPCFTEKVDESFFEFVGIFIGKAMLENFQITEFLSDPLLKMLFLKKITFDDLKNFNETHYNNINTILEGDVENLGITFSYNLQVGNVIPLKEGGKDIEVTNDNKYEYAMLYTIQELYKN